jgi:hypothetical protein
MKLNLSNIKRIPKRAEVKSDDAFERDAKSRQRWLDDSDVVHEVDKLLINSKPADEPDELRATLNQNVSPDYSDETIGDVLPMASFEVLCAQTFCWVPRNSECLCGSSH